MPLKHGFYWISFQNDPPQIAEYNERGWFTTNECHCRVQDESLVVICSDALLPPCSEDVFNRVTNLVNEIGFDRVDDFMELMDTHGLTFCLKDE
jgi:hypothetical protein